MNFLRGVCRYCIHLEDAHHIPSVDDEDYDPNLTCFDVCERCKQQEEEGRLRALDKQVF